MGVQKKGSVSLNLRLRHWHAIDQRSSTIIDDDDDDDDDC